MLWRTETCGHSYQDGVASISAFCACNLGAIGRCSRCQAPICGHHSRMVAEQLFCAEHANARDEEIRRVRAQERAAEEAEKDAEHRAAVARMTALLAPSKDPLALVEALKMPSVGEPLSVRVAAWTSLTSSLEVSYELLRVEFRGSKRLGRWREVMPRTPVWLAPKAGELVQPPRQEDEGWVKPVDAWIDAAGTLYHQGWATGNCIAWHQREAREQVGVILPIGSPFYARRKKNSRTHNHYVVGGLVVEFERDADAAQLAVAAGSAVVN